MNDQLPDYDQLAAENFKLKAEVERLKQLDSMKQNFMAQLAAKTAECEKWKESSNIQASKVAQLEQTQCNLEYSNEEHRKRAELWREAAIERDVLLHQNAELCVVLEKSKTCLNYVLYARFPMGDKVCEHIPQEWYQKSHEAIEEARAILGWKDGHDSTALDAYVKPLMDALEQAKARLEQSALPFDDGCQIISQALADWKARRQ